jgi:hypothetical protein
MNLNGFLALMICNKQGKLSLILLFHTQAGSIIHGMTKISKKNIHYSLRAVAGVRVANFMAWIQRSFDVEGDIKFSSLQVLVSLPRVKCYINSIIYKLVICSDQRNLLSVIVTTVINTMFNVHMIFNFHGSGFQGSQFWDFESD